MHAPADIPARLRPDLRPNEQPVLLGDIPLTQIRTARLPYVGGGWRVVEIHLTDGRGVRFLLDRNNAEKFVQAIA